MMNSYIKVIMVRYGWYQVPGTSPGLPGTVVYLPTYNLPRTEYKVIVDCQVITTGIPMTTYQAAASYGKFCRAKDLA